MAKLAIQKATTDVTVYLFIQDSSVTTGAGLTGLVYNSAGLVCYYVRPLAAAAALSLATQTVTGAHSDGGFVEVSSANMPGIYRLDLSDVICATGVNSVVVMLKGATNMAPVVLEIQLTSYNPNDAVRMGMTALPNAAADAAGGLPISDLGGLDLDGVLSGNVPQTGDSYARIGAPVGASISADIATVDGNVDAILVDTADMQPKLGTVTDLGGGATIGANLLNMAGATFATGTDSLEAIRDRGDAAWTTGAGGSDRLLMVDTTIATLASQTSFTLTAGSADDNAYVNCTIVIEDVSTATQKAIGVISAYTGATKTVTLKYDPGVFTMAATDKVYILAENSLKTTAQNRQLDVTATGAAGIDWGNVENPTTAVDLSATDIQLCDTVTTVTTATNLTNERGKYAMGAVWIGPTANTNTVSYVDGITTNPVSTIAAAKTIADALNLRRFYTVRTGASQIGADMVGYEFNGDAWSVTTTGGSRDVSASVFWNAQVIGGTFASTSAASHWFNCEFVFLGVSIAAAHMERCTFGGTLTLSAAGNYDFIDCASVVPGGSAPVFSLPAGVVNVSFRRWSGGITISGITTDTTISIDMVSGGTVTLNGADGNVQIRGLVSAITDNRTGSPTLGQNAAVNITKINAEADTAISDAALATAAALATHDGKLDTVDTNVDAILVDTGTTIPATLAGLNDLSAAQVNAEVVDALATDTYAEPGQGAPAATATLAAKINYLYKFARNKLTQTATTLSIYNDAGAVVDQKATVSDDATTYTRGEIGTGP